MTMQATDTAFSASARASGNVNDAEYSSFLERVQARFLSRLEGGSRLFQTDATGLWEAYLSAFPEASRQYHNCSSCRRFLESYGGLVTITEYGATDSALWDTDDAVGDEAAAIGHVIKLVRRAKVTGPFLSKETTWGNAVTGVWKHLHLTPPRELLHASRALTPGQAMAEKREDFKNVVRALHEYPVSAVEQALALLKSDALYRSEKVLGQAQWLADLHAAAATHAGQRANVIWRHVAAAPAGFCHPRSSMIGTLLDDIVAGVPFEDASRKFADKMHPLRYQRPQAAPSAGNIAAAEKLVEKLGIARSLERRFARVEEIEALWRVPAPKEPGGAGGVFGHLKAKGEAATPAMAAPPQVTTWVKFARDVLPSATALEAWVPSSGDFMAILTAEHADAPPILQWDREDRRNPFSWYLYHRGSSARQWGLKAESWTKVTAVALYPGKWHANDLKHHADGGMLILEGAKDSVTTQGNCLFPETLKSELHGARATIEAYSRTAKILGVQSASACGLMLVGARVRVADKSGVRLEFKIDRWE